MLVAGDLAAPEASQSKQMQLPALLLLQHPEASQA
jgi:hypothetical protein